MMIRWRCLGRGAESCRFGGFLLLSGGAGLWGEGLRYFFGFFIRCLFPVLAILGGIGD